MSLLSFGELTEEEKLEKFMERINGGKKIEADDWMPDDYREQLIRLISMHGISEIMGALPEKEWVPKAPTLRRKLAIMSKVQDEMGHGQLLLRVTEDLLRPSGKKRGDIMDDLLTGRLKFHNVFHMPAPTWADGGVIAWLVGGAAIISHTMMLNTSYAPYCRALRRICAEEVLPAQQGEAIIMELAEGTTKQRKMLQDSINRWWESMLMFFGPDSKKRTGSSNQNKNIVYKLRTKLNEELRQDFLTKYIPRVWSLGLTIPDETLHYDESEGKWIYQQPDWDKFKQVVSNNGPKSKERLRLREIAHESNAWVREALGQKQTLQKGTV